jgi:uncharacterized membrane protein YgcG
MIWLLVVLLLAAAAGILGAVIKVAAVLLLSFILAILVIVFGTFWYLRYRMRRLFREVERADRERRGGGAPGSGGRGYPTSGSKRPDSGPGLPS